ncbi:TY-Chap domain-containing protein [Williamsia sp. MIQD14]|uniref:TY-Chap domain-containing protein n=1 Tax=Williamsia sp. MIQD14 TaxID=3425703 RepID=UPI003DA1895E
MRTHFDLDDAVAAAWRSFRIDLADRLALLERDDTILVAQSTVEFPEGPHGAIRFSVTGSRRVRATVVASDLHPTEACRLDQVAVLGELGWRQLRSGSFVLESGRRGVDGLAVAVESTLRRVWEVLDPSFLAAPGAVAAAPPLEPDIPIGVVPTDQTHLRHLVVEAIERITGTEINVDSDGDIRIPGAISSWIRIAADTPAIEMVACIVERVADRDAAGPYLAAHVTSAGTVGMLLADDRVFATMTLEASVFHERNLSSTLAAWLDFLTDDAPEIRSALTDRRPPADTDDVDAEALPEALMTLIQLDQDGPLTPAEVAQICGHHRGDILEFMRLCTLEEISWGQHADAADESGDGEEAAACRHEQHAWAETVTVLRQALRWVVLPPTRPSGERRPTAH